jgi:hypothetical protein
MACAARMSWSAREGAGEKYGVRTMTVSSPAGQDGIFISYRTGGGSVAVGRLHGRLAEHFGRRQVLYAPNGIRLAQNFAGAINNALRSCKVLLALIGGRWVTVTGRDGRRRLGQRPAQAQPQPRPARAGRNRAACSHVDSGARAAVGAPSSTSRRNFGRR